MSEGSWVDPDDWNQMVEICRLYYIEEKTQTAIAKKRKISLSKVSRLLKQARELGVVRFHIEEESSLPWQRLDDLEGELLAHFQLERAIVIDFPYKNDGLGLQDDRLHQALGSACADFLRGWLRSGDHIGVGGGRGPYYTAKYLRDTAEHPLQRRLTDIKVTSLTGSMSTTPWTSAIPVVDADENAVALASAFQEASHRRLNAPVAPPGDNLDAYWGESGSAQVLSLANWKRDKDEFVPNVGLVGVGALAGEHRFCKKTKRPLYALDALNPELNTLLELIQPFVDRGYYPVGDVCNRLFFVESQTKVPEMDEDVEKAIKDCVSNLNKRILSVNKEQLRMIRARGRLIAVAGGQFKFDAISSLLTRRDGLPLAVNTLGKEISVNILCTDVTTAERLLRRALGQEDHFA